MAGRADATQAGRSKSRETRPRRRGEPIAVPGASLCPQMSGGASDGPLRVTGAPGSLRRALIGNVDHLRGLHPRRVRGTSRDRTVDLELMPDMPGERIGVGVEAVRNARAEIFQHER